MAEPIPTDTSLHSLPRNLPAPEDDGAAKHLPGMAVPEIELRSTSGRLVNVGKAAKKLSIFFFYPATVAPGIPIPGEWSEIPGARGCTIQNCAFRDAYEGFRKLRYQVFGVSGQGQGPERGLEEQMEFSRRENLPYELLNDSKFELADSLRLPTFVARLKFPEVVYEGKKYTFPLQNRRLIKRLTIVAYAGRIEKVFYPVFPPDRNAAEVMDYLKSVRNVRKN
ncbi:MAG: peroxiredoxin [Thermoplasmata archaeon]|nr:peroxiredoxin [Candidatus Sysuiplasma jiujiangense]